MYILFIVHLLTKNGRDRVRLPDHSDRGKSMLRSVAQVVSMFLHLFKQMFGH